MNTDLESNRLWVLISVFFQVGKREIWGNGFLAIAGYNSADGAMPEAIAGNYWSPTSTNAFYPAAYNAGSNAANINRIDIC
jgi:hypothetical protein